MPSTDDYRSSAPRETVVSMRDVYFISMFTQKTQQNPRTQKQCRQVAHGGLESHRCLSGRGTTPVHVTREWQYSTSCVASTCRHTPQKPKSLCDLFVWICFPGSPPLVFIAHRIKGKDKISSWPRRSQRYHTSFVWRLGGCRFELLKGDVELLNKSLQGGCLIFLCAATLGTYWCLQSIISTRTSSPSVLGERMQ